MKDVCTTGRWFFFPAASKFMCSAKLQWKHFFASCDQQPDITTGGNDEEDDRKLLEDDVFE